MKKENGFSLIEVMVALFVSFVVLMFVFGTFITTRKALQFTEDRTNALFLGHTLLNDARSQPLPPLTNPNVCTDFRNGSSTFSGRDNGVPFSRVINFEVCQSGEIGRRLVRSEMTWTEDDQKKSLTLETVITDTSL